MEIDQTRKRSSKNFYLYTIFFVYGIILSGCSSVPSSEEQNRLNDERFEQEVRLAEYEQCMNFEAARLQALATLDSSETGFLRDLARTTARGRVNSADFRSYALEACREFRP